MKLKSWNRFNIRSFSVVPSLMGSTATFAYGSSTVTIKIPSLDSVSEQHDEHATAIRGSFCRHTDAVLFYYVLAVDVTTTCNVSANIPYEILSRHPNAYDLIPEGMQGNLNSISQDAATQALSAFEYWVSLLRWVTGFHRIGREARIGSESGWTTYLHDIVTETPVWAATQTITVPKARAMESEEWQCLLAHISKGEVPPMHSVLLDDAKHCLDINDYRRALVDLCVACESYLRKNVIDALPSGIFPEALQVVELANINQYITHMFPALLSDTARSPYKNTVKKDLSSLFSMRNDLMHMAKLHGATKTNCERYMHSVEVLFSLK